MRVCDGGWLGGALGLRLWIAQSMDGDSTWYEDVQRLND